jgi:diguanylate cyclase (GGDEF)-like protein
MSQDTIFNQNSRPPSFKRRLYIIGSAFGVVISILYAFSTIQEGINAGFVIGMVILLELSVFFLLFVFAAQWIGVLEASFYYVMVASLLLLVGVQIHMLYLKGVLSPDKLGFLINSLVLWLVIYQLGSFLALPFRHTRRLLVIIWVGMVLIIMDSVLTLRPPEEWRYSYLISWVAGLGALLMASLQIHWLGQRQRHQATTDSLTGLANRHQLADLLTHYYERAMAQQGSFTIMLIDIDYFKSINDNYGHAVGDQVLKEVAAAIMQQIGGNNQVGRWGGDEFLVLLEDANLHTAQQAAERIRAALDRCIIVGDVHITVSIGVHAYRVGQSIEDTLACADQALYLVKQAGRNQVGIWAPN